MSLKVIKTKGNIFDTKADVICNAVNCIGVMGAGVAKAFADKFPEMYWSYQNSCNSKMVNIGKGVWIKSENEFQGDYVYLLKSFHEFIYKKDDISPNERANIILEIANGLRDSVFVIDQEINFYATILRILKQLGKF